jgi:twinkle protein
VATNVKPLRPTIPREHIHIIPLSARGLHQDTCQRYGYGTSNYNGVACQVAPFCDAKGRVTGQKLRLPGKDFRVVGEIPADALFGRQLLRGNGRRVIITEGEIDAMSVSQAMGNTWPVVSVPHGAGSAVACIKANLEVLEGYDKVVLCFDNDEPGQEAAEAVIDLFSPGKIALADLGSHKDPNEMLTVAGSEDLRNAIWNASDYRPDGVVNLADLKERISAPLAQGIQYPWQGLNRMLYGFRPQELITWTAGTGVGKTAVVSELVYYLIMQGVKVGIVYLEEGVERAGRRIVGLHMNKPLHLPNQEVKQEDFDAAFEVTLGSNNLYAYDHFGSLDETVLLNRIRYMVKGLGCQVVVLDHISMVVSGADLDADERRMLDHTMTNLRTLTQETKASFHVVSHLRRGMGKAHEEGGKVSLAHLRGTQAIAQLSDAVIACERNQQADDNEERNTTILRVLKNRYAGITGPACELLFDHETGRLKEIDEDVAAFGETSNDDF